MIPPPPTPNRDLMDLQMQGLLIDSIVFVGVLVAALVLAVFWVPDIPEMIEAVVK